MFSLIRIRARQFIECVTGKNPRLVFMFRKAKEEVRHFFCVLRIDIAYFFGMKLLQFKKFRLDCKVFALYVQCLFFYRKYNVADPTISNRFVKLCYKVHKRFDRRDNGWGLHELGTNG